MEKMCMEQKDLKGQFAIVLALSVENYVYLIPPKIIPIYFYIHVLFFFLSTTINYFLFLTVSHTFSSKNNIYYK